MKKEKAVLTCLGQFGEVLWSKTFTGNTNHDALVKLAKYVNREYPFAELKRNRKQIEFTEYQFKFEGTY